VQLKHDWINFLLVPLVFLFSPFFPHPRKFGRRSPVVGLLREKSSMYALVGQYWLAS
jgi:hypothetical protein